MDESHSYGSFCIFFHQAVELIGRRWSGVILRAMLGGAHRFGDIRSMIPEMSDRMLSERLKELEAEGIIRRTVFPETPVRIEYQLTPKGQALSSVVAAVAHWAQEWLAKDEPSDRLRSLCGSTSMAGDGHEAALHGDGSHTSTAAAAARQ